MAKQDVDVIQNVFDIVGDTYAGKLNSIVEKDAAQKYVERHEVSLGYKKEKRPGVRELIKKG